MTCSTISSPDGLICDYVILDAEMIRNLPRSIAAATGVDAMCHAIECFTSNKANPLSDTFALEAFDLIMNNIEAACDDPEAIEAKNAMQVAAFYGGVAITASGTTGVHALSYPLGGRHHIAHGVSNVMLLVPVMEFNEPACRELFARAWDRAYHGTDVLATDEEKSKALVAWMGRIVEHLDIPTSLSGRIRKAFFTSSRIVTSPVPSMEASRASSRTTCARESK